MNMRKKYCSLKLSLLCLLRLRFSQILIQSAIDLDRVPILLPSPILGNWNSDNESYSLDLDSAPADDSFLSFDRYLNPSDCVSSMQSSEIQNADSSSYEIVESFEHLPNNLHPFSYSSSSS